MRMSFSPRMLGLDLDAREAIKLAARHGFRGVDLRILELAEGPDQAEELAGLRAEAGLEIGSWPLPAAWRGAEDRFRRDLDRLPPLADLARRLGLDRTGTWIPVELDEPEILEADRPDRAAFERVVGRLDAIASILERHGHRLGLEPIGLVSARTGLGVPVCDGFAGLGPILEALRERGRDVGVIIDAFHLAAAGESGEDALRWGVDAVVAVHVADVPIEADADRRSMTDDRRALPGTSGVVPCGRLLRMLSEAGYSGPVMAEPRPGGRVLDGDGPSDPDVVARRAAEALAAIWPVPVPGAGCRTG